MAHYHKVLTRIGDWFAHPVAFVVLAAYGVLWVVHEGHAFDFSAGAELATLLIAMVIKRSDARDDEAINAKLDEVLRVLPGADHRLAGLDSREIEEVVQHRDNKKRHPKSRPRLRK